MGHMPHAWPHHNFQSPFSKVPRYSLGPLRCSEQARLLLWPQLLASLVPQLALIGLQNFVIVISHLPLFFVFEERDSVTMTPPKVAVRREVKVFTLPSWSRGHFSSLFNLCLCLLWRHTASFANSTQARLVPRELGSTGHGSPCAPSLHIAVLQLCLLLCSDRQPSFAHSDQDPSVLPMLS